MADNQDRQGAGNEDVRTKPGPADAEDVLQEKPAAAGPEEASAKTEEAPRRPPGMFGYDPDQWPEPN